MHHLKNVFTRNIPLKFISLALAVLIWYYVGGEVTDKTELSLPFTVSLQPGGDWIVMGQKEWTVKVALRGSRSEIQRIRAMAWSIRGSGRVNSSDLPGDQPIANSKVLVDVAKFNFPFSGVEVVQIEPGEIDVRLGKMGVKRLKVVPSVEGRPAEGFEAAFTRVRPSVVQVRGPLSVLGKTDTIETRPVIIDELSSPFDEMVRLRNRIEDADVELDETDVRVTVWIREIDAEVQVPRVPVHMVLAPDFPLERFSVKLREETVDVIVRGPKLLVDGLDSSRILITAPISRVRRDMTENSIDLDTQLRAEVVGFSKEDCARIEVVLPRTESTYILTRLENK